jgi:site-specific DNA-cytosine methylase
LLESESVQRDSPKKRASGKNIAADAEGGAGAGIHETVGALCADTHPGAYSGQDAYTGRLIPQPIGYRWQNNETGLVQDGTAPSCRASTGSSGFHEMNHPVVLQPFTKAKRAQSNSDDETWVDGQVNQTLSLFDQGDTRATTAVVNMQGSKSNACVSTDGTSFTLNAMHGHDVHAISQAMAVRRLTPRECERLQGFPDDWTLIPWRGKPADQCPDGPRYKALGNSMAVNCMEWIGERIAEVSK